jgi:hypothetical protein
MKKLTECIFYQKMELLLELDGDKKKNQEVQKLSVVQRMEIEQLLNRCSQKELLCGQQSDQILELQDRVKDLLNNIKVGTAHYFLLHCYGSHFIVI